MGAALADHEFTWVTDAEPHATRRRAILAKYGKQVRELYGYDNWTAVQVRLEERVCLAPLFEQGS